MGKYKLFYTMREKAHIVDYYQSVQVKEDFHNRTGYLEALCGQEVTEPDRLEVFLSSEAEIRGGEIYIDGDKKARISELCSDCKTKYLEIEN